MSQDDNLYDETTVGLDEVISVVCPEHGPYEITMEDHRNGEGCPVCGEVGDA